MTTNNVLPEDEEYIEKLPYGIFDYERFIELTAIYEYYCNMPRKQANERALNEIRRDYYGC